ncbi:PAS domain S-box protein [Parvibaculum sp.]|uniref:PAS domain S-box protein n=1 Tax=Parvibaculum sp. TaxID=2024848 RepID=UPI0025FABD9D|nr:PAS domain S-box protein [Parvibaculum sp.]
MAYRQSALPRMPAVFVFDPATKQLVSQNASAGELLAAIGWQGDELPTLSAVERLLIRDARVSADPQVVVGDEERNYELRRRCRRPDSSEMILTRIWTPGSSTTLIVADITQSVQAERQLRFAQMTIDRLMKSDSLSEALVSLLRAVMLYAGWKRGAAWIPKNGVLSIQESLSRQGADAMPDREAIQKFIRPLAETCWQNGETSHVWDEVRGCVILPLRANGEVIAVLSFCTGEICARDQLTLEVLDGITDRIGMALKCRINAEEAASARRQLDELLDAAGDAIVVMDAERRIRIFNKRAEKIFGYTAEEAIGNKLDMLLPQGIRARHRTHVARFAREKATTRLMGRRPEVKGRRKDGTEFPAEASVSRIMLSGELVFTAVLRDLTALRQVEDALRARERQMRMIIEAMPFGLATIQQETGEILFANSAFSALVDCGRKRLSGRHITDFADSDLTAKLMARKKLDGRMGEVEGALKRANGEEFWCVFSAVALSMGGQNVVLIGCYDVTDRRRAEEALRKSAANLAAAERIAHLGNWQLDIKTNEISCSEEAFRIFGGRPQEDHITLPRFLERVHPSDRPRMHAAVREAIARGTPFRITLRIVFADGDIRYIRNEAEPVRDSHGNVVELIGTVLDITDIQKVTEELRAARNKAEYANRTKSQFLANMSHELRTPLNAIIGFSELMATDVMGPMEASQYQAYAKDINDSGQHLLAIVNDILDLNRIEVGVTELEETEVDVEELGQFCMKTVEGRARAAQLDLVRLPVAYPVTLHADKRLVRQILLNLLSNAIKFTPAGGTVSLAAELAEDGALVFSVEDTGIGIAVEDIARVTEPFIQVENHMSRRFDGVGLGLALTKQFIELHGGVMSIESTEGKGTRVDIRFPPERVRTGSPSLLAATGD